MLLNTMRHKHIKSHQNINQNDANMVQFFITRISMQLVKLINFYCKEFNI